MFIFIHPFIHLWLVSTVVYLLTVLRVQLSVNVGTGWPSIALQYVYHLLMLSTVASRL